jgi:hypothetical protein
MGKVFFVLFCFVFGTKPQEHRKQSKNRQMVLHQTKIFHIKKETRVMTAYKMGEYICKL